MGDALIWKIAAKVGKGEWLWLAAAERSYLIVERSETDGVVTFVVERGDKTRVVLPAIHEDDAVELEVLT